MENHRNDGWWFFLFYFMGILILFPCKIFLKNTLKKKNKTKKLSIDGMEGNLSSRKTSYKECLLIIVGFFLSLSREQLNGLKKWDVSLALIVQTEIDLGKLRRQISYVERCHSGRETVFWRRIIDGGK